MASLSLFVIERHSRVWLSRLLIHRSHQSKLPILSEIPCRKSLWSQFKVLTAGRLGTRRKVAESFSRLYGLSNVMVSLSLSNRASLKTLAFASSDSPKSSIKIPYPERNTVEKKPMVAVFWKALPLDNNNNIIDQSNKRPQKPQNVKDTRFETSQDSP
ncbi:unnamed protein product [Porites evermanni]|uniref:Uncharacterized protein n=1 Tax=Porites evermanni TaxID=104178 RepID=A0ABN8M6B6_9CNID|nr:unnamed protein product [Porites evermanni]